MNQSKLEVNKGNTRKRALGSGNWQFRFTSESGESFFFSRGFKLTIVK